MHQKLSFKELVTRIKICSSSSVEPSSLHSRFQPWGFEFPLENTSSVIERMMRRIKGTLCSYREPITTNCYYYDTLQLEADLICSEVLSVLYVWLKAPFECSISNTDTELHSSMTQLIWVRTHQTSIVQENQSLVHFLPMTASIDFFLGIPCILGPKSALSFS